MYIITGNKGKLLEYQAFFPEIKPIEMDLPELQELDLEKIQKAKINQALKHLSGDFLIDDVSFYLDCIPGLPGPMIKWFLQSIKREGLLEMATKYENFGATAKCTISYVKSFDEVYHFEGEVWGNLVRPRGEAGFGFDGIFKPDGLDKTYGEMTKIEKNKYSHRGLALTKLSEFLNVKKFY